MTQHTPGPWLVGNEDTTDNLWSVYVEAADTGEPFNIAEVVYGSLGDAANDAREAYANARLIAAAPDLLEALETVLGYEAADSLLDQQTDPLLRRERRDAMHAGFIAIAKARGEQVSA